MGRPLTLVLWLATALLILLLQHHHFICSSAHDHNHSCPTTQQLALLNFKQNLSTSAYGYIECGALSYPKTNEWEMSADCCTWDGVTCDPWTGDVIELDLSCSQLEGVLHSNSSLFHLPHLQRLNLAFNDFYGSVLPRELGRLATSLTHLNLSHCQFSGLVPPEMWHLSKLVLLDLSYNDDGKIEFPFVLQNLTQLRELSLAGILIDSALSKNMSSLSSLTFLDLSYTGLRGRLPGEIFHLPNLQTLWLSGNGNITGVLPPSNWSSSSNMRELDLSEITMIPEISDVIGSLKRLKSLRLLNCKMSGAIPIFILNLKQLRELDLSDNKLELHIPDGFADLIPWTSLILYGNAAKTKQYFPSWLANLTQLVHLDLSFNSLSGPLPSSNITRLQKLKFLDLSYNSLSGEIPSWVFDLPLLEVLNLGDNHFMSEMREFRFTNSLRSIDLSWNELTGSVPQSIFRYTNSLQSIDLSWNELTGSVPQSILGQPGLQVLRLAGNKLSGPIEIEKFSSLKKLEDVDLSHNQFHGRFPEWLCNSSSLYTLDLSVNSFSGVLPHCIGNLGVSLGGIDLSVNNFSGTIPSTFANLNSLIYLNLHSNQFEGNVASLRNCTYLEVLHLGNNKFKGTFPYSLETLPELWIITLRSNEFYGPILISHISHNKTVLSNLMIADLSNNKFSGEIPNALTGLVNLVYLDMHKNEFHGTIPTTFARGNRLRSLNLHDNHLHGTIPSSLASCTELQVLDLGKNHINDTFPSWLATLSELHVLVLSFNRFHGPINTSSTTETPFPKLRIIDLSSNEFTGNLPELFFKKFRAMEYVSEAKNKTYYLGTDRYYYSSVELVMKGVSIEMERILTILTTIDLSNNQFKGEIPKALGSLKFLRQLNLSHNNLVGPIPSVLGNLSLLEVLDLNSNQLEGEIPPELPGMTSLGTLNLSYNNLGGRIPWGKQFNTFLNDSYYGNPGLCGFPLSNCEKGEKSYQQMFHDENDSGFMDGFTWEVVLLGYGCGIVLGFIIGCVMFWVGKPKWFTGIVHREVRMKARRTRMSGYKRHVRRN